MIGGGWRVRAWSAPRDTLKVSVAATALVLVGVAPTVGRDVSAAPASASLQFQGLEVTLPSGQPAVRWNGLTARGRWVRAWGPHPTQGSTTRRLKVSFAALEVPGADMRLRISYAAVELPERGTTPKLVGLHRSGLSSFIGKQVWGPSSGGYLEVGRDIPPGTLTITGLAPQAVIDDSANDRTLQVSWAEVETPNPDRRARVSWATFETPEGPVKARISWAVLEVPNAPRQLRVSWAEFSTPDVPVAAARRLLVSWAALQVPVPIDLTSATPPLRTWVVPRESRTWVVPRETRTWKVR